MQMKWIEMGAALVVAAAGFAAASAQAQGEAQTPQQAVASRQGSYREIGAAMKGLSDQFRGGNPASMMVTRYAEQLRDYGADQLRQTWFPAHTGLGQGLQTQAKPEIWSKPADFDAYRTAFARESAALAAVAKTGNMAQTQAQYMKLGKVCASCHEGFRAKDKS